MLGVWDIQALPVERRVEGFFRRELSRYAACGREWVVRIVESCPGQTVGLADKRRSGGTRARP
jgi:hypothetical protein